MRQRFVVLTLLISLFAFSAGAASAQTTSSTTPEPTEEQQGNQTSPEQGTVEDDGRVLIPFIVDGEEATGQIIGGVGATLFTFDGTAGDLVTISVTQITDDFDPFIVLLGPRGEVVASDDDSGTAETFSSLIEDAELPTNGSYLVVVSDFSSVDSDLSEDDAREFSITVTGNHPAVDDPDYSEDSLLLFPGRIEVGGSTEGFSDANEPVFYYFLSATAGQTLDIVIEESDFDTLLMLFGQDGERIALNDDDTERSGLDSAIRGFEVPEDGAYMLMVTTLNFDRVDADYEGGTFTLSVSEQ